MIYPRKSHVKALNNATNTKPNHLWYYRRALEENKPLFDERREELLYTFETWVEERKTSRGYRCAYAGGRRNGAQPSARFL